MMAKENGQPAPLPRHTFMVTPTGDRFRLFIADDPLRLYCLSIADDLLWMKWYLTAAEVRELADACLAAIGWTKFEAHPKGDDPDAKANG